MARFKKEDVKGESLSDVANHSAVVITANVEAVYHVEENAFHLTQPLVEVFDFNHGKKQEI